MQHVCIPVYAVNTALANMTQIAGMYVISLHVFAGHFIDKPSKQCYGIMGVQLTAFRECTRDTEWKLLRITVLDFSSKAEDVFAAERTAADAARLQAPLQFHGDEPELAEALNGLAPSNIELRFDCHTILVCMPALHSLIVCPPQKAACRYAQPSTLL